MEYKSFEEMPVWQKAMELAVKIHGLTERLPRKEDYGLTSQIRRSGLSVSDNISEGFGRKHTNDKLKFYYNARGSLAETKNHLIYGHKVGYFCLRRIQGMFEPRQGNLGGIKLSNQFLIQKTLKLIAFLFFLNLNLDLYFIVILFLNLNLNLSLWFY
mgnify:CR=1 FL=1